MKAKNPKHNVTAYLNINSLRYKFCELQVLLIDRLVDIVCIAETKLDTTFSSRVFSVEGHRLFWKDIHSSGGGLVMYARSDLPVRPRPDLECASLVESIVLEGNINDSKLAMIGLYKPPTVSESDFERDVT
jgi:exonuclease III